MQEPDVVCLGETMAMVTPSPTRPLAEAQTFALSQGGAESNVAVWLARLGYPVSWCSRLGEDALGRRVLAEVAAAGVDISLVELDGGAPTGVYFKDPQPGATSVLYYRAGSAAAGMDERDADRARARPVRLLHLTGITPALSDACARAVDHALTRAAELGVTVSFDVNYRAALWPSPARRGRDDRAADPALRHRVRRRRRGPPAVGSRVGARTVGGARRARRAGGEGWCRADHSMDAGGAVTSVAARAIEVMEPVGAGDAFAAGWLYGWLRGLPPRPGCGWGT
jgi:2-dehydro-3-deoxygluconokinase